MSWLSLPFLLFKVVFFMALVDRTGNGMWGVITCSKGPQIRLEPGARCRGMQPLYMGHSAPSELWCPTAIILSIHCPAYGVSVFSKLFGSSPHKRLLWHIKLHCENCSAHNKKKSWVVGVHKRKYQSETGSLPFSVSLSLTLNLPFFISTH